MYVYVLQGAGQDRLGIYIKSVVAGGAADAVSKYYVTLYMYFFFFFFFAYKKSLFSSLTFFRYFVSSVVNFRIA